MAPNRPQTLIRLDRVSAALRPERLVTPLALNSRKCCGWKRCSPIRRDSSRPSNPATASPPRFTRPPGRDCIWTTRGYCCSIAVMISCKAIGPKPSNVACAIKHSGSRAAWRALHAVHSVALVRRNSGAPPSCSQKFPSPP